MTYGPTEKCDLSIKGYGSCHLATNTLEHLSITVHELQSDDRQTDIQRFSIGISNFTLW